MYFHSFLVDSSFHETCLMVDRPSVRCHGSRQSSIALWLCDWDSKKVRAGATLRVVHGPLGARATLSCQDPLPHWARHWRIWKLLQPGFHAHCLVLYLLVVPREYTVEIAVINSHIVYLFSTFSGVNTFLCSKSAVNSKKLLFWELGDINLKEKGK